MPEGPQRGQEHSATGQHQPDRRIGAELAQRRCQAAPPVDMQNKHPDINIGAAATADNRSVVDAPFHKVIGAGTDRTAQLRSPRPAHARIPLTAQRWVARKGGSEAATSGADAPLWRDVQLRGRPGFDRQLARSTDIIRRSLARAAGRDGNRSRSSAGWAERHSCCHCAPAAHAIHAAFRLDTSGTIWGKAPAALLSPTTWSMFSQPFS
jgi:hypothetical protein